MFIQTMTIQLVRLLLSFFFLSPDARLSTAFALRCPDSLPHFLFHPRPPWLEQVHVSSHAPLNCSLLRSQFSGVVSKRQFCWQVDQEKSSSHCVAFRVSELRRSPLSPSIRGNEHVCGSLFVDVPLHVLDLGTGE